MPKFTGFVETTYREDDGGLRQDVVTTISYWPVAKLLERLEARMEDAKPGAHLRIDLIAWDVGEAAAEAEIEATFSRLDSNELKLTGEELDALWKLLVTDGKKVDAALKVHVLDKVQRAVEQT